MGVVGLNGSGKDTLAAYLKEKRDFAHKDLGQEIRDELKVLGKNSLDRNEMIALGNERRQKFGFDYWVKRAVDSLAPAKDIIITSVRNPVEVEYIKSNKGIILTPFADLEVRYKRTVERVKSDSNAHGDVVSFEDFKLKEEKELRSDDPSKQQNLKCISMADYKLDNNGAPKQFFKEIDTLLKKLDSKKVSTKKAKNKKK
ncbi:MAG: AAA family ATPase [archaeon]